jgi:ubiquinone/menaquinone biosynthesis C-methylase UbiE
MDYSRVAARYDANPFRGDVEFDSEILPSTKRILDLACGTGNYLLKQIQAHAKVSSEWHGIDANAAMLDIARAKVPGICLCQGRAEQLPYRDGSFDYIVCRYAFHHFKNKDLALLEACRLLSPAGRVRFINIVPELSPAWWVYKYFPSTVEIDRQRFWALDRLTTRLRDLGFDVKISTQSAVKVPRESVLKEAHNRETSQLVLIDDADYIRGIAALEAESGNEDFDGGLLADVRSVRLPETRC